MLAHNQGALLNASRLAAALMVSAQTTTRYVDLLVDLLLVRRLRPFHHTNPTPGTTAMPSPRAWRRLGSRNW
ncbi:MAG: hypothetical protein A3H96_04785 [Acidobacteria bacterium RIFCSPLOWO2_02_FULL_67_36]|nr:MAG: hypothetical protein A3H96_04785 [Acidobacteria bacterium RIFCSPLOWO2_02_FULL_67_36]OFW20067.1 MAG: hypothetical protein A3G21_07320 [Acidobacteria bacterium RIFCSPLOWO2_12_FULL_66_21]